MIEYKLLTAANTDVLENKVDELIVLGFKPLGGVAVFTAGPFTQWAQAMSRESEKPPAVVKTEQPVADLAWPKLKPRGAKS